MDHPSFAVAMSPPPHDWAMPLEHIDHVLTRMESQELTPEDAAPTEETASSRDTDVTPYCRTSEDKDHCRTRLKRIVEIIDRHRAFSPNEPYHCGSNDVRRHATERNTLRLPARVCTTTISTRAGRDTTTTTTHNATAPYDRVPQQQLQPSTTPATTTPRTFTYQCSVHPGRHCHHGSLANSVQAPLQTTAMTTPPSVLQPPYFTHAALHGTYPMFAAAPVDLKPKAAMFYGDCFLCSGRHHSQNYCPLRQCSVCHQYGHSKRVCQKYNNNTHAPFAHPQQRQPRYGTKHHHPWNNHVQSSHPSERPTGQTTYGVN